MRRTDDFLADLETQLAAAAAGALPRRRHRLASRAALRPALAVALVAAAVAAFGLADRIGSDGERVAAPPPAALGATVTLDEAMPAGRCGLARLTEGRPPGALVQRFETLRRASRPGDRLPRGVESAGLDRYVRRVAPAGPLAWLVPSARVVPGGCSGAPANPAPPGPGVCAVVDLKVARIACFTVAQIEKGTAVASLGRPEMGEPGGMIVMVPDAVRQVELRSRITQLDGTWGVDGNLLVADLNGTEPGESVQVRLERRPQPSQRAGVAVLNGTTITGLAVVTAGRIEAETGFTVERIGDNDDHARAQTLVFFAPGHRGAAGTIRDRLGAGQVLPLTAAARKLAPGADVVVLAGADLAP